MSEAAYIRASDLLRRLEPAVRPGYAGAPDDLPASTTFDAQPFDVLLAGALNGEVHSDQPLRIACDLQSPLTESQAQRLSLAADRALAGGAKRAVMLLDARALLVDVPGRAVLAEVVSDNGLDPIAVDAALFVPRDGQPDSRGSPFAGLNTLAVNVARRSDEAQVPHVTQQLSPAPPAATR